MRNKPITRPISIPVDKQNRCLYSWLLEMPDRPLPKEPTHYILVDMVNTDLSIKRVTIYFNPADTWTNPEKMWEEDRPRWIGGFIANNLGFLGDDPNIVTYRYLLVEVSTNLVIYKSFVYGYYDPEYL